MAILSVKVKRDKANTQAIYVNKISAEDYKKIAILLKDLKNLNVPIDKAIKEFKKGFNDWDIALGG
jgi:hypothetical protein